MNAERKAPAYRIETERLVLRCFSPEDGARFRALLDNSDEHLRPWIPWMKHEPMSLPDTIQRLRGFRANFDLDKDYRYLAFLQDETAPVGMTGLHPRVGPGALETGYMVDPAHAGKGYALEMAAAMVKAAFELHGVDRMEIRCDPRNAPSWAIARKLGFTHEATMKRYGENSDGELCDLMIWTLFADRYRDTPAAAIAFAAFDAAGTRIP